MVASAVTATPGSRRNQENGCTGIGFGGYQKCVATGRTRLGCRWWPVRSPQPLGRGATRKTAAPESVSAGTRNASCSGEQQRRYRFAAADPVPVPQTDGRGRAPAPSTPQDRCQAEHAVANSSVDTGSLLRTRSLCHKLTAEAERQLRQLACRSGDGSCRCVIWKRVDYPIGVRVRVSFVCRRCVSGACTALLAGVATAAAAALSGNAWITQLESGCASALSAAVNQVAHGTAQDHPKTQRPPRRLPAAAPIPGKFRPPTPSTNQTLNQVAHGTAQDHPKTQRPPRRLPAAAPIPGKFRPAGTTDAADPPVPPTPPAPPATTKPDERPSRRRAADTAAATHTAGTTDAADPPVPPTPPAPPATTKPDERPSRRRVAMSIAVMLVHTYYGYNASGGSVWGSGSRSGRSVRTSLIVVVVAMSIAVMLVHTYYGYNASGGSVWGSGSRSGRSAAAGTTVAAAPNWPPSPPLPPFPAWPPRWCRCRGVPASSAVAACRRHHRCRRPKLAAVATLAAIPGVATPLVPLPSGSLTR